MQIQLNMEVNWLLIFKKTNPQRCLFLGDYINQTYLYD